MTRNTGDAKKRIGKVIKETNTDICPRCGAPMKPKIWNNKQYYRCTGCGFELGVQ